MAKQAAAEAKPSLTVRIKEFYQEVMTEISKVTWPSQDELKSSTQIVLLMLFLVGALIYVYDTVFQNFVIGVLKLV